MTFNSCIYFYIVNLVDVYTLFLCKWKINVIVECLLNWRSITHLVSKILLPSVLSIKTISQIKLYFLETDWKNKKNIVYHRYTEKYTTNIPFKATLIIFIYWRRTVYVFLNSCNTNFKNWSLIWQMIGEHDLILRMYFVMFIVAVLEVKLHRCFASVWFFPYIYTCIYNSVWYTEEYMIYSILFSL
jgi:hypothetical protein